MKKTFTLLAFALCAFFFSSSTAETAFADGKNWMAGVDDERLISHISIPGTHDSAAFNDGNYGVDEGFAYLEPFTQTQSLSLTEQINSGVRYFDLRVRDDLSFHHGSVDLHGNLRTSLTELFIPFIKQNPSETLLIRVQNTDNHTDFSTKIHDILQNYSAYFWKDSEKSNYSPLLKDVRGKIIFLDDTKGNCFTYNGEKYGLKYDGDHQIIQDDYTTITIANKLEKTLASIEVANQISDNRLYLNHSSATNPVPQDFAENNNTPIRKYLESHSNIAHTGVIITDFIGRFGLSAEDIYRCNLREWTATEKLFNHGYTVKYGTFSDTWTSYIGGCDIQHTGLGGTSDFDREEKSHLYLGHSYVRFFIHVLSGKVKIALVKDNSKGFDDPWETNWHVSSDGTHSYGMEVDANRPYYLAYEYDSGYSHTAQFEVWISISEVGAKG